MLRTRLLVALIIACASCSAEPAGTSDPSAATDHEALVKPDSPGDCSVQVTCWNQSVVSCTGTAPSCAAGTDRVTCNGVTTICPTPTPQTLAVSIHSTGVVLAAGAVTSTPSGIDCDNAGDPGPCSASFLGGTSVTLHASPFPGVKFTGWSGCTTSSGTSCTVSITGPKSIGATFNCPKQPCAF